MALYHCHIGTISRSTGRSAVQSAAYITGEKLAETRRGLRSDYRNRRSDIAFCASLAPKEAPFTFHTLQAWDELETFEDRYAHAHYKTPKTIEAYKSTCQSAKTIELALPKELSLKDHKKICLEFAQYFVDKKLKVDVAIHRDEGNPHAHFLISRRAIVGGEWALTKDRETFSKKGILEIRRLYADKVNEVFFERGIDERLDHRSYAEQGIDLLPTKHRGWYADHLQSKGEFSRIHEENQEIREKNVNNVLEHPCLIVDKLTKTKATFTQRDLYRELDKILSGNSDKMALCIETILPTCVFVGMDMDGQYRYTTQAYLEREKEAVKDLLFISTSSAKGVSKESLLSFLENQEEGKKLTSEQTQALIYLCKEKQISVLMGRAGTGKTFTMTSVCRLHEKAGMTVFGGALSKTAADHLGADTGIKTDTLKAWMMCWETYEEKRKLLEDKPIHMDPQTYYLACKTIETLQPLQLSKHHVFIVDEAGMVGTEMWGKLLKHVQKSGAKLIALGDDHQFKAVEAGDFFRPMIETLEERGRGVAEIKEITRQNVDWMREASHDLSQLNVHDALSVYEQRGHVHGYHKEDLPTILAQDYVERLKENKNGLVLAYSRQECRDLNHAIQERLRIQGQRGKEVLHHQGSSFCLGDKIVFLENDKAFLKTKVFDKNGKETKEISVTNGMRAVLMDVQKHGAEEKSPSYKLTLNVSKNKKDYTITFHTNDYPSFDLGYALTTHKSQGLTVDWVLLKVSKGMKAQGAYVAMTRHRQDVQLYYDKGEFSSFKQLQDSLARVENKDLAYDYTIRPEGRAAYERVQDYRRLCRELAQAIHDKDWELIQDKKEQRDALGRMILDHMNDHRRYLYQAGYSQTRLEIALGLKRRPLSWVEERAYERVDLYKDTALQARDLWKEITNPGIQVWTHPLFERYEDLRYQRDDLAHAIMANLPLHRPFMQEISKSLGYGKHVVQKQAEAYVLSQGLNPQVEKIKVLLSSYKDLAKDAPKDFNFGHEKTVQQAKVAVEIRDILTDQSGLSNVAYREASKRGLDVKQIRTLAKSYEAFSIKASSKSDVANAPSINEIKTHLENRVQELAFSFFDKNPSRTSTSMRFGRKGSVYIGIGRKKGVYTNFESGRSGDVFTMIEDQMGINFKGALSFAKSWLGLDTNTWTPRRPISLPLQPGKEETWKPLYPINAPEPDLLKHPALNYVMKDRREVGRYAYKDAAGQLLGYVIRLEDKKGSKITPTLTYCENDQGKKSWRWKGFIGQNRPLYGLDYLAQKPQAPVLVVEGEKTSEAARTLFKGHVVVTWSGGASSVLLSDWSPLKGRDVVIWPDHDAPGKKAALALQRFLIEKHDTSAKVVDLPSTFPAKWDLADKLPEGITRLEAFIKTAKINLLDQEVLDSRNPLKTQGREGEDTLGPWIPFKDKAHDPIVQAHQFSQKYLAYKESDQVRWQKEAFEEEALRFSKNAPAMAHLKTLNKEWAKDVEHIAKSQEHRFLPTKGHNLSR